MPKKYRESFEGFMKPEKWKEYVIFTIIFFSIGFSVFGGMAIACRELLDIQWNAFCVTLVYSLGGGWLFGGLASGIFLGGSIEWGKGGNGTIEGQFRFMWDEGDKNEKENSHY